MIKYNKQPGKEMPIDETDGIWYSVLDCTIEEYAKQMGATCISFPKFKAGDKLTWELFLEACKEVDEKCKSHINEDAQIPLSFSTIKDAEQYFRSIGGITVEEFAHKMKEDYGI